MPLIPAETGRSLEVSCLLNSRVTANKVVMAHAFHPTTQEQNLDTAPN